MKSILLTLTLKSESEKDSILIEHLEKFSSGKGKQERSFEIRRLLLAGLLNRRPFSESSEVKNQSIYQNNSVGTATNHSVKSFNSVEDVYHNSSKQLTEKTVLGIPDFSSSKPDETIHKSVTSITVVEVDTKKDTEQINQQSLPALSLVSEIANLENVDGDMFAGIRDSILCLEAIKTTQQI